MDVELPVALVAPLTAGVVVALTTGDEVTVADEEAACRATRARLYNSRLRVYCWWLSAQALASGAAARAAAAKAANFISGTGGGTIRRKEEVEEKSFGEGRIEA